MSVYGYIMGLFVPLVEPVDDESDECQEHIRIERALSAMHLYQCIGALYCSFTSYAQYIYSYLSFN